MKQELQQLLRISRHEGFYFWPLFGAHLIRYLFLKFIIGASFAKRNVHGKQMILSLTDPGISRTLFLLGDREREHYFILKKALKPGMNVLDLGANIGYYVLLEHTRLAGQGSIIAVEPVRDNFDLLQRNIKYNKLQSVTTLHAAVSDQKGKAKIYLSQLSNVHSLLEDSSRRQTGEFEMVETMTLSNIVDDYGNIDFIRMDIEGFEVRILQSILQMNKKSKFLPSILFELHQKTYNHDEFIALLTSLYELGYIIRYAAVSNKGVLAKAETHIEKSIPTDGTIRHIVADLSLTQAKQVIWSARCVLLGTASN